MYTRSTPNPSKTQWRKLILAELEPQLFGGVEVEIRKVLKAQAELKSLGVYAMAILQFIE